MAGRSFILFNVGIFFSQTIYNQTQIIPLSCERGLFPAAAVQPVPEAVTFFHVPNFILTIAGRAGK